MTAQEYWENIVVEYPNLISLNIGTQGFIESLVANAFVTGVNEALKDVLKAFKSPEEDHAKG